MIANISKMSARIALVFDRVAHSPSSGDSSLMRWLSIELFLIKELSAPHDRERPMSLSS